MLCSGGVLCYVRPKLVCYAQLHVYLICSGEYIFGMPGSPYLLCLVVPICYARVSLYCYARPKLICYAKLNSFLVCPVNPVCYAGLDHI